VGGVGVSRFMLFGVFELFQLQLLMMLLLMVLKTASHTTTSHEELTNSLAVLLLT